MVLQSVLSIDVIKNNIEVQQMMTGIYETIYGIFNHIKNIKERPERRRPLGSVAFHRSEDFTTGSLLEDTMKIFRDLPIKDIFGINYLEFMKLPVDIVEMMIKIARDHREKESKTADNADRTLRSALKDRQHQQLMNLNNKH